MYRLVQAAVRCWRLSALLLLWNWGTLIWGAPICNKNEKHAENERGLLLDKIVKMMQTLPFDTQTPGIGDIKDRHDKGILQEGVLQIMLKEMGCFLAWGEKFWIPDIIMKRTEALRECYEIMGGRFPASHTSYCPVQADNHWDNQRTRLRYLQSWKQTLQSLRMNCS
ncbi:hypothetical protein SKAU_G00031760 [Synaphobranchus kaupii]|uniref:Secreted protein n=1 Tax=Synaphobranchus kaupii TaxID=118154 RepID=A0A9Q1GF24_SYNKA|nr:hypothetical protein SKAU_G00031760 [Synaphobranchus kaupii]